MNLKFFISAMSAIAFGALVSCKHKPAVVPIQSAGSYPADISNIIINRCATAGCHNETSYTNAANLRLDDWRHLFEGGANGAVVVPYSTDYSSLLYFINTDSALGPVATPTMPLNHAPLTKEEYLTIRNWIANGAPDKDGNIPFAPEPDKRQKMYMTHLGCDLVAVIDAEKQVVMRYIPVGEKPVPEGGTSVKLSPDGRYAYVVQWFNDKLYKIDTYTDKVIASFTLPNSFWNAMTISADGQQLALTNQDTHELVLVNAITGAVKQFPGIQLQNPNGVTGDTSFDTLYVTGQFGNVYYKISEGLAKAISIDGKTQTTTSGNTPDPFDIKLSPDGKSYFISCPGTNEIRIFNRADDHLLKTIPVGKTPKNMSLSRSAPYLFVACMEDENPNPKCKGSVYVVNYNTFEIVRVIKGKFYQPHAIAVNDQDGSFYIFNRNKSYDGPAPHHQGPCAGRNGFYEVYDMKTMDRKTDKRFEVLVDPYASDTRFSH